MADITKTTVTQGANTSLTRSQVVTANEEYDAIPGKRAGEDLDAGDLVFLWTDEMFYKSNGAAAAPNAAAVGSVAADCNRVRGMVMGRAKSGYAVDVAYEGRFGGYSGLTPGANLFLSATPGAIADAAAAVSVKVAFAIDARTIQLLPLLG